MRRFSLPLAFLLLIALLAPISCAPTQPEPDPAEKAAQEAKEQAKIESIVAEYIKSHPGEILDSIRKFQIKERAALEKKELQKSLNNRVSPDIEGAPLTGDPDAPVTIVEFSDFQCPYCARARTVTSELLRRYKGKVRMVFKHYPLDFHKKSRIASHAAMAAGEQGKFWEFKEKLMALQNEWTKGNELARFLVYAQQLGLDVEQFGRDMQKPEYEKIIDKDMQDAKKIGVSSTPTFFVNGVIIRGAQPVEKFAQIIDLLLEETKKH